MKEKVSFVLAAVMAIEPVAFGKEKRGTVLPISEITGREQ